MDVLAKNGMQATIAFDTQSHQPKLMVQGHDSPVLTYNLTRDQLDKLTQYGTNFANKQAYNTFTDIVKEDFDIPRNWVHAKNVNSRVVMGLHGYRADMPPVMGYGAPFRPMGRIGIFESIRMGMPFGMGGMHQRGFWQVATPGLAWGPRMQDGFHLRRMNGMLVTPNGAPIIPERRNGYMRPGELQSGAYGFYWKQNQNSPALTDQRQVTQPSGHQQQDGSLLDQLTAGFKPVEVPKRSNEPALAYDKTITSPVYFSNEKFQQVLSSHGLIIDEQSKTLTVQSQSVAYDVTFDLSDEHLKALTSNSLKEHSLEERLDILNTHYLSEGFQQPLTMEMLNSTERFDVPVKEELASNVSVVQEATKVEEHPTMSDEQMLDVSQTAIKADGMVIPLISEKEGFHWQQDRQGGRDVVLGNVVAFEREGKSYLHAEINGVAYEKELTQKEFKELHYRNDDRRLELIDQHLDGIRLERGDYKGEYVNVAVTNGADLAEIKPTHGWYREGADGREVTVGDIGVDKTQSGKFIMTAVIDGQTVQHEISEKDFNKFVQLDDYHRMRLFSKIFDEVAIKNRVDVGVRVGAAIAATLTVLGEVAMAGPMLSEPRGPVMGPPVAGRAYFKPGVDSPAEIAARNFEAAMVTEQIHQGLGRT